MSQRQETKICSFKDETKSKDEIFATSTKNNKNKNKNSWAHEIKTN